MVSSSLEEESPPPFSDASWSLLVEQLSSERSYDESSDDFDFDLEEDLELEEEELPLELLLLSDPLDDEEQDDDLDLLAVKRFNFRIAI